MTRRAAIYIRVSTLDQAIGGYSLSAQRSILEEYCCNRGLSVIRIYADEGISAKDIAHRPAMCELLESVETGSVDFVVVWSLSRLTRSVSDLYTTLDLFQRSNCGLLSYTEAFDTETPTGRAMIGLLGVFAQMEREITAERVKAAMSERASQGKRTTNEVLGYDLDGADTLKINGAEAERVRYIFDRYLEYKNFSAVAELCDLRGYKGKRGGTLKAQHIKIILTRPIYIGFNTYLGCLYHGAHPAIIERKIFDKVQRMIGNHRIFELIKESK